MKTKKLLLFALVIRLLCTETTFTMSENTNTSIQSVLGVIAIVGSIPAGIYAYATHAHNQETHAQNIESGWLKHNHEYLATLNDEREALLKNPKENVDEIKKINARIRNFTNFEGENLAHAEKFDPTRTYKSNDPIIEPKPTTETDVTKKTDVSEKKPGLFKQAAAFMFAPIALAHASTEAIADYLPVNSIINHVADQPYFKDGLLDQNRRAIGSALVAATIAYITHKAYAWYTNEERILAGETVIELEEQAKELAAQYKQEMQKTSVSADDKKKLEQAYTQYMEELAEEIKQQKIIAGHGMYKKLLIGAMVVAGGAAGLPVVAQYYMKQRHNTSSDNPTSQASSTPVEAITPTEQAPFQAATQPAVSQEELAATQEITVENLKKWTTDPSLFNGDIKAVYDFIENSSDFDRHENEYYGQHCLRAYTDHQKKDQQPGWFDGTLTTISQLYNQTQSNTDISNQESTTQQISQYVNTNAGTLVPLGILTVGWSTLLLRYAATRQ
jgi:hypothetical protein